jgi:REP element-mobilizing transposase RayT
MARRGAKTRQLNLRVTGKRGGLRFGAGRPRKAPEDRKGHGPRPELSERHPVHVTLKVLPGVRNLRRGDCFRVLRKCFVLGKDRNGFRLVHFTVQSNHLHLICEAPDRMALARGMQGLAIRMAKRLNLRLSRRGKLFAERYHARALRTPTEVRNTLVYVLNNTRRHARGKIGARDWVDSCSSAAWFDGWRAVLREPWMRPEGESPVVGATTWLLGKGWRRLGLLRTDEQPAEKARRGSSAG